MPLSFSTCWNSHRHTDGKDMLQEIADLGFTHAELGHGIRLSLMPGVENALEAGVIRLTSLHNFCPLPPEVTGSSPNCYEFTSHRAPERERALRLTCQTIDFAERFGVDRVVLHLGRVPIAPINPPLIELVAAGKLFSRRFVKHKLAAVRRRESAGRGYWQRAATHVERALEHAQKKNIVLCIESRDGYEEVPSEREFSPLFERIGAENTGYWHDFGHVQIKHNLKLLDHAQWLEAMAPRLVGCHVHDVQWPARDHRAPFTGGVNFGALLPLLPHRDIPMVFEMSPKIAHRVIYDARETWMTRWPHRAASNEAAHAA